MSRQSIGFYQKRSATNEFLLTRSQGRGSGEGEDATGGSGAIESRPPAARFTDMLDREGLVAAIDGTFSGASRLCVVAVRIEATGSGVQQDDRPAGDALADLLEPIVSICRAHNGLWACLGPRRFAFAFADLDPRDGGLLAERMQKALPGEGSPTLTIGIAAYPTANDPPAETVQNAEKALVHAGFFGPGSITPFDAVSLNISGDRLYHRGDIRGAIDEYRRGLRLAPTDANLLNSLGVCYGVKNQLAKALDAFETVIWLDPMELMAVYNKGYVLLRQGHRDQALECFLAADALETGVFEVVFHIGQLYLEKGLPEDARPYLEAATRANDRSGSAYRFLGDCLDQLGLTKEAIQAFKSVVKINPDEAASLATLGRLYAERRESLDVAAVLCEQSVRIEPNNARCRHHLGRVYLEQGRLDEAMAEFELADALGHDSREQIATIQNRLLAAKAS